MATPPVNANANERAPKGGNDRRERRGREGGPEKEKSPYTERVVFINRVAKVG